MKNLFLLVTLIFSTSFLFADTAKHSSSMKVSEPGADFVPDENKFYTIQLAKNGNNIEVPNGTTTNNVPLKFERDNGNAAQQFKFEKVPRESEWYYIVPKNNPNLCLTFQGYQGATSGPLYQFTKKDWWSQQWKLESAGNGQYYLRNRYFKTYITSLTGNGLGASPKSNADLQGFRIKVIGSATSSTGNQPASSYPSPSVGNQSLTPNPGQFYKLQLASNGNNIDIPNGSTANNIRLKFERDNGNVTQQFKFEKVPRESEWYYILPKNNQRLCLTFQGRKGTTSGSLYQYTKQDWWSQQWKLESAGNGIYYLKNRYFNTCISWLSGNGLGAKLQSNANLQGFRIKTAGSSMSSPTSVPTSTYNNPASSTSTNNSTPSSSSGSTSNSGSQYFKPKSTRFYNIQLAKIIQNIDVPFGLTTNNIPLKFERDNGHNAQQFKFAPVGRGSEWYYIHPKTNTNLYLTFNGSKGANAGALYQYTKQNLPRHNQQWKLEPAGNGRFYIRNRHHNTCISWLMGNGLGSWTKVSTDLQGFKLIEVGNEDEEPEVTAYNIIGSSNKALDVPGYSKLEWKAIGVWDKHTGDNQKWILEEGPDNYYYIIPKINSTFCLTAKASNSTGNGNLVQVTKSNNNSNQLWGFRKKANGKYSIQNKAKGLFLNISVGNLKLKRLQNGEWDRPMEFSVPGATIVSVGETDPAGCDKFDSFTRVACHNCYETDLAPDFGEVLSHTTSVEIDIHDSKLIGTPQGARDYYWHVKHWPFPLPGDDNNLGTGLEGYLEALVSWSEDNPDHDVITVFIDKKQNFTGDDGTRSPKDLDDLIKRKISINKIFRPINLRGTEGNTRLGAQAGNWPSDCQLEGKFIFVLTGGNKKLQRYADSRRDQSVIFVAPTVNKESDITGIPNDFDAFTAGDVVFYNIKHENNNFQYGNIINERGYMSRVWGAPENRTTYNLLKDNKINFVAFDNYKFQD